MVQHTPWAVLGGPGRFSCVGADVSSARGPPFGRFKGKGSLEKGGRFPLSGGNVERSETKGVGTIRNPPFPKRLFGDFLSAQKVTRRRSGEIPILFEGIFRLRAGYFPEKESSQSSPGLRARTQESCAVSLAFPAGAVPS